MSDERAVHIVMGVMGEYSDRTEWPVAAYFDKAEAEAHSDAATKYATEKFNGSDELDDHSWRMEPESPFDPSITARGYVSYTGVNYFVYDVPLRERAPERDAPANPAPTGQKAEPKPPT